MSFDYVYMKKKKEMIKNAYKKSTFSIPLVFKFNESKVKRLTILDITSAILMPLVG